MGQGDMTRLIKTFKTLGRISIKTSPNSANAVSELRLGVSTPDQWSLTDINIVDDISARI